MDTKETDLKDSKFYVLQYREGKTAFIINLDGYKYCHEAKDSSIWMKIGFPEGDWRFCIRIDKDVFQCVKTGLITKAETRGYEEGYWQAFLDRYGE